MVLQKNRKLNIYFLNTGFFTFNKLTFLLNNFGFCAESLPQNVVFTMMQRIVNRKPTEKLIFYVIL